eukprot:c28612_g1_i2 orf=179-2128(+)
MDSSRENANACDEDSKADSHSTHAHALSRESSFEPVKFSDGVGNEDEGRADSLGKCKDELGLMEDGSDTAVQSQVHVEQLPEEPVFDGTEKIEASGDTEGVEEEGTRSYPIDVGSEGNEQSSRFGPFDFVSRGVDWPERAVALKNFVREQGIVVSSVIRRLSGKKEDIDSTASDKGAEDVSFESSRDPGEKKWWSAMNFRRDSHVNCAIPDSQWNVQGPKMKGRITLFSMSGCQDCRAARSLLRKKGLNFIEVNIDVFPQRRLELEERTGTSSVPQVFFNESFLGGIDELKALDASGELDEKLQEVFETDCPDAAPLPPVYGEDEPQSGKLDELADVVRKLREKVQIKDRFYKMRFFSRCFLASNAVEFLAEDQYCERDEAVQFGRKIVAKHFCRHVLEENIFEDGNQCYRFLEHDPVICTKCYNFHGITNDLEPRPAADVEISLRKLTLAIFESYISEDGKHVDYQGISMSEEFRRYIKLVEDLHRIDLLPLSREERLAFFINLYNIMAIHAVIILGHPNGPLDRRRFFGDFQYLIGGHAYSLSAIENGVLRGNQRPPYNLIKPFGPKDKRLPVALSEPEPLMHFALACISRSSPAIRYSVDFGRNELEILKWIVNYVEPSKAEELLQLLDGSQIKVVYQPYDWAPNF